MILVVYDSIWHNYQFHDFVLNQGYPFPDIKISYYTLVQPVLQFSNHLQEWNIELLVAGAPLLQTEELV